MTQRLGRYQLLRSLASGGMGEIYLAEHTGLAGFAKRVALKQIRPNLASDPAYVQLFLNEARIGSFLNHPNIVHIFDVGHEEGKLWLVMEYVDGIDLKRLHRRATLGHSALGPELIASVMIEVLSALEEAHAGGPMHGEPIIHRDMSPENILIAKTGAVKVLDFGLAKWFPGSHAVPSMEGSMIFGKVRYMPPEQLLGDLIDVRSDLFSLGVVMYEVLRGRLPFGSGNANEVLYQITNGTLESPTAERHGADEALDEIIFRALRPEPNDRYQTAKQMRYALVEYIQSKRTIMPLETLRRLLVAGSSPAGHTVSAAPVAKKQQQASSIDPDTTELAFSVGERCGKCGGAFTALFLDGLIVDRCVQCRGVWLDSAEVDRLLGSLPKMQGGPKEESDRAPLDRVIGSCPTCRIGLQHFDVPNRPAALEICPRCFGVWFDKDELKLLTEDVVPWLRSMIATLRQSRGDSVANAKR